MYVKLALAGLVSAGCSGGSPCGATDAVVERVIDGDTVELEGGTRIRFILVDTPESTGGATDCYGTNAKTFTEDLVLGKEVHLSYSSECTDRYDRTLAYVSVGGQDVNKLIIERGYGCVLHIPPAGDERVEEFQALQLQAERNNRGLWGACNPLPPACD